MANGTDNKMEGCNCAETEINECKCKEEGSEVCTCGQDAVKGGKEKKGFFGLFKSKKSCGCKSKAKNDDDDHDGGCCCCD